MRVSIVLGAIVLVSITMHETTSTCRFLTVEGSYVRVSVADRKLKIGLHDDITDNKELEARHQTR